MNKKIIVLNGAARKNGSTAKLVEAFADGAKSAGNRVKIFYLDGMEIHSCKGCLRAGRDSKSPCSQKDDMAGLKEQILGSDMVVFVTPLYYFGMSAQLKAVIDRFYSFNGQLSAKGLKTALIVAAWDSRDWTMQDISAHYQTLCKYLNFKDQGMILGFGCGTVSMIERSGYPQKAYEFGKSMK